MSILDLEHTLKQLEEVLNELSGIDSREDLTRWYQQHLGKKSLLMQSLKLLGTLPAEIRSEAGASLNRVKARMAAAFEERQAAVGSAARAQTEALHAADVTLPGFFPRMGTRHPISDIERQIRSILTSMGFEVASGPEIEDDQHAFEKLNIPAGHPARDMWDTFWIDSEMLLRPHTSPVQIRVMQKAHPHPMKIICPGRVYRYEDVTSRSECQFHQVEGLHVGTDVTMRDLITTLDVFIRRLFGKKAVARYRNSYFPFTEPSLEVDVSCVKCGARGCSLCKKTGWLEILGAGMVNPRVLADCGYDPAVYSGYAFGLGIERIAMLRYEIDDIRWFFRNDLRFMDQFDSIMSGGGDRNV